MIVSQEVLDRFWANVAKAGDDECWLWTGPRNKQGYGRFWTGQYQIGAHRLSLFLVHGKQPSHIFSCHRCDNPPCVNPNHLFPGTHEDNMRDCRLKGRQKWDWSDYAKRCRPLDISKVVQIPMPWEIHDNPSPFTLPTKPAGWNWL